MSEPGGGSVSRWIDELKAGDRAAVQPLYERYFDRLVRLARKTLQRSRRAGASEDEEDAALSAFDSFCGGAERGRFPQLEDRDDLWRLLVTITARKALDQVERGRRLKRGSGRVVGEADLAGPDGDEDAWFLDSVIGSEPTPEFAALVAEQYQRLLRALDDSTLGQVALGRMEGYTTDEIAGLLGCSRRTVARKLDLIRRIWTAEAP